MEPRRSTKSKPKRPSNRGSINIKKIETNMDINLSTPDSIDFSAVIVRNNRICKSKLIHSNSSSKNSSCVSENETSGFYLDANRPDLGYISKDWCGGYYRKVDRNLCFSFPFHQIDACHIQYYKSFSYIKSGLPNGRTASTQTSQNIWPVKAGILTRNSFLVPLDSQPKLKNPLNLLTSS